MPPSDAQPGQGHAHAASDPPADLGGYRLVELLGRGGMGEVWRGERGGPGGIRKRAAIKRILPRLANDPTLRERFLAEARTNARLEHPNIVQVLDFGDSPEPYLVLEYVEGITAAEMLRELIQSRTKLPAIAAAFVCAEIATGLDYAHRRKDDDGRPLSIIHRDVSPQNILISVDGAVKITDFGVARAADNRFRTQEGMPVGKAGYMAPEQLLGQPVDARADVFALGVTLWEMLTASPLLPREDPNAIVQALMACQFRTPSQIDARLPASVDALVMPALAREPEKRYASAAAFAQAIRAFIHSLAPGFDSTELAKILARLVPSVAFHGNTPPPVHAGAPVPTPPVAVPGAMLPHAPREMPAFVAAPAPAPNAPAPAGQEFPATIAMSQTVAAPTARPVPSAHVPQAPHVPQARNAPHHAQAPHARVAPAPPVAPAPSASSRAPVLVGGIIIALAASASFASVMVWRHYGHAHGRHSTAAATRITLPARQPLIVPSSAVGTTLTAPPEPNLGVQPPPAQPMLVAPPPTQTPIVETPPGQPTSGGDPNSAGEGDPNTQLPSGHPNHAHDHDHDGTTSPRNTHTGDRQAAHALQSELAGLRGMVRACLGIREGSGAHVSLMVRYDGSNGGVAGVDVQSDSVMVGERERVCVSETVRSNVHPNGVTSALSVRQEFEF